MTQIETKRAGETRNGVISFSSQLDTAETMSGSPTITSSPSGLTLSSIAVSSGSLTINGETVTTGRAVQFQCAGGTDGVLYTLTCIVPATSLGQVNLEAEVMLEVRG